MLTTALDDPAMDGMEPTTTRAAVELRPRVSADGDGHASPDYCVCLGEASAQLVVVHDNAVAESFNATIKKELIHQHLWLDAEEARSAVFDYIERYYNRVRKQRRLGKMSPLRFEESIDIPDVNAA